MYAEELCSVCRQVQYLAVRNRKFLTSTAELYPIIGRTPVLAGHTTSTVWGHFYFQKGFYLRVPLQCLDFPTRDFSACAMIIMNNYGGGGGGPSGGSGLDR